MEIFGIRQDLWSTIPGKVNPRLDLDFAWDGINRITVIKNCQCKSHQINQLQLDRPKFNEKDEKSEDSIVTKDPINCIVPLSPFTDLYGKPLEVVTGNKKLATSGP